MSSRLTVTASDTSCWYDCGSTEPNSSIS